MKTKYIILFLLILTVFFSHAQSPFYTFLNGWRGAGVTEVNGHILCVSNYQLYTNIGSVGGLKVDFVNSNGIIVNTWELKNDSARLEDANPGGHGIVSFYDVNNWIGSSYVTNLTGSTYSNAYRFNSSFDTVNKAILIPRSINVISNGGLKNLKYINDTTIILVMDNYTNSQGLHLLVRSIDALGNQNWQTEITSLEPTLGGFMNSMRIDTAEDGGFFISCFENPNLPNVGDDNQYYLLVKLNSTGNIEWKKRITDGIHVSQPGAVIQKDTNSYLVTWAEKWLIEYPNWLIGERSVIDSASVWLGEIDLQGNFKWKKSLYNTTRNCDTLINGTAYKPYSIIHLSDGNYLICVDFYLNDATYIKVSPNGDVIWNRRINLFEEENADVSPLYKHLNIKYTKESADGGILGIGEYYSAPGSLFPNGILTSVLIKLDKYGCLEPGCHLEGCTDKDALNYNPEAVYDCGCIYDPCPESNQITIDVRQNRIMSNTDFYLKAVGSEDTLIGHTGFYPSFYSNFKESVCLPNDCDQEYELYINIRGNVPPNSNIPFQSNDPYSIGYYAYFNVLMNDSIIMDIGRELFVVRDTTIRFKFCIPDTISTPPIIEFNIYPNPSSNYVTIETPSTLLSESTLDLKILDMLGKEVLSQKINNNQTTISIENLSLGLYTVIIFQKKSPLFTQKIIKQ